MEPDPQPQLAESANPPDIVFTITDLLSSLSTLLSRSYATTTRAWFRLNPLETLLLACDSAVSPNGSILAIKGIRVGMGPMWVELVERRPAVFEECVKTLCRVVEEVLCDNVESGLRGDGVRCVVTLTTVFDAVLGQEQQTGGRRCEGRYRIAAVYYEVVLASFRRVLHSAILTSKTKSKIQSIIIALERIDLSVSSMRASGGPREAMDGPAACVTRHIALLSVPLPELLLARLLIGAHYLCDEHAESFDAALQMLADLRLLRLTEYGEGFNLWTCTCWDFLVTLSMSEVVDSENPFEAPVEVSELSDSNDVPSAATGMHESPVPIDEQSIPKSLKMALISCLRDLLDNDIFCPPSGNLLRVLFQCLHTLLASDSISATLDFAKTHLPVMIDRASSPSGLTATLTLLLDRLNAGSNPTAFLVSTLPNLLAPLHGIPFNEEDAIAFGRGMNAANGKDGGEGLWRVALCYKSYLVERDRALREIELKDLQVYLTTIVESIVAEAMGEQITHSEREAIFGDSPNPTSGLDDAQLFQALMRVSIATLNTTPNTLIYLLITALPTLLKRFTTWTPNPTTIATQLLDAAAPLIKSETVTAFKILACDLPWLIDRMVEISPSSSPTDKCTAILHILNVVSDTADSDAQILLGEGCRTLFDILPCPPPDDISLLETVKQMAVGMRRKFVDGGMVAHLFVLHGDVKVLLEGVPVEEKEGAKRFFRYLVMNGKRADFRNTTTKSSRNRFVETVSLILNAIDRCIMCDAKGCDDIFAPVLTNSIRAIEQILSDGDGTSTKAETVERVLNRIPLIILLCEDEFETIRTTGASVTDVFDSIVPLSIRNDENVMAELDAVAVRMANLNLPRCADLVPFVKGACLTFLNPDSTITLDERITQTSTHISTYPFSKDIKTSLIECGYSPSFWTPHPTINTTAVKSTSANPEETYTRALVALCQRYLPLAQRAGVVEVEVQGEKVAMRDVFDIEVGVAGLALKGRRAAVGRAIEEEVRKRVAMGDASAVAILDEKHELLHEEARLDEEYEQQMREGATASVGSQSRNVTAHVKVNFLGCAASCGANIAGCYAPNGVHCEKPLEIGLRDDLCIFAICDENGLEIENVEAALTPSGVYLFKAYTNNHPLDTSSAWFALFTHLLLSEPPYVPAIILPETHPTTTTFTRISRRVAPELAGFQITFKRDTFASYESHFDTDVAKVRAGRDIVLTRTSLASLTAAATAPDGDASLLSLDVSERREYDLGGELFRSFVAQLQGEEARWKMLGGVICKFLGRVVGEGGSVSESARKELAEGINWDRWQRGVKGEQMTKDDMVEAVAVRVVQHIDEWCESVNVEDLFVRRRNQFEELRSYLMSVRSCRGPNVQHWVNSQLKRMQNVLFETQYTLRIDSLEPRLQVEVMRWIFKNEDKVWRFRGGRHGETLDEFMAFLPQTAKDVPVADGKYPGVCVFMLPRGHQLGKPVDAVVSALQAEDLIAYAVGEFVLDATSHHRPQPAPPPASHNPFPASSSSPSFLTTIRPIFDAPSPASPRNPYISPHETYEVVTAWVHPNHRHRSLALQMYARISRDLFTTFWFRRHYLTFDVLEGTVEAWMKLLGPVASVVARRALVAKEASYEVEVEVHKGALPPPYYHPILRVKLTISTITKTLNKTIKLSSNSNMSDKPTSGKSSSGSATSTSSTAASGGNTGHGNPMTTSDSSRIQSSQAKAGHDTGAGSFAARAQSAGARNANAGKGK
ncbi:hypothetical protein HK104_010983 [Borealophlyctis nickersoniae]|nr:hypothetical protein HK104_010983 [Borealophlyctis nickersoniae]